MRANVGEEIGAFTVINGDSDEVQVHGLLAGELGLFSKHAMGASGLFSVYYVSHISSGCVLGEFDSLGAARRARDLALKLMPEHLYENEPWIARDVIYNAWLLLGFDATERTDSDFGNVILTWTGETKWAA